MKHQTKTKNRSPAAINEKRPNWDAASPGHERFTRCKSPSVGGLCVLPSPGTTVRGWEMLVEMSVMVAALGVLVVGVRSVGGTGSVGDDDRDAEDADRCPGGGAGCNLYKENNASDIQFFEID